MAHARAIVATDGEGAVLWTEGDVGDDDDLGMALDLLASAVRRLAGRRDGAADFDNLLVRMDGELWMVAKVASGYVAIFADESVTPGLLFTHVRRLQNALGVAA